MPSSKKRKIQRSKHDQKNFGGLNKKGKSSESLSQLDSHSQHVADESPDLQACQERNLVKFFNQIFTENRSHAHRMAAVELMCEQLHGIPVEDVHSQAMTWLTHLSKTIESCTDSSKADFGLTCHVISQLLVLCSSSADLRRSISMNFVPKVLSQLLGIDHHAQEAVNLLALVNLMKICIKYYGGSCLPFKNKVESCLVNIAFTHDTASMVAQACTSTLAYLPYCGGQGTSGTKHSEMWTNQMNRLLSATDSLITYLYTSCGQTFTESSGDSVSGQAFPCVTAPTTAQSLREASHYLLVYLKTIQAMLTTPSSGKVSPPLKQLLSVICRVTSVSSDSVIFRRKSPEKDVVHTSLPALHNVSMSLLSAIVSLCGLCIYPYATTICELLTAQLNWTKAMLTGSMEEKYITTRICILETICHILKEPGLYSVITNMADSLIEHVLNDVKLTAFVQAPGSSVAKKPRLPHNPAAVATRDLLDPARRKLVASAFQAVEYILKYCCSSVALSTRGLKLIYEMLVNVTSSIQNGVSADCYSVDSPLRLSVYRALLASIYSYNTEMGPLTHIATVLIANGMTDPCPKVRSLCTDSLLVCQLAIQPAAPPLVQHVSAFPVSESIANSMDLGENRNSSLLENEALGIRKEASSEEREVSRREREVKSPTGDNSPNSLTEYVPGSPVDRLPLNPSCPETSIRRESPVECSPEHAPTSLGYSPCSPRCSPASPSCSPASLGYRSCSPRCSPASPRYSPAALEYSPCSPRCSPASPSHSPVSPLRSPTSPRYGPASPSRSQNGVFETSSDYINTSDPGIRDMLSSFVPRSPDAQDKEDL